MKEKIGFIGAGNMSSTIIRGFVKEFKGINNFIYVSNRRNEKAEKLSNETNINFCHSNAEIAKNCNLIFLGIKPYIYEKVLKEIAPYLKKESLIISLAAGINMREVEGYFQHPSKVIRIMPNIPVTVGEGMIPLSTNDNISIKEKDLVVRLLRSIGKVDEVEESMIDSATTISGCSPAFIAMFVEALADGSVLSGMPRDKAYIYAAQTLIGTGKMLLENEIHPAELKDMVSSPKGVTIEGVRELEKGGFRNLLIETVKACEKRMKEINNE